MSMTLSCSKQDRAQKKLGGIWHISEYRYRDLQGFSYYPEVSGELFFENCESRPCTYSMSISYNHPQITGNRTEAGTYLLNDAAESILLTPIANGIEQASLNNGIIKLTKSDLKFQYVDPDGYAHDFLFER